MNHDDKTSKVQSKGFRMVLLILAAFFLFGILCGLRASTSILTSTISEWTGMSYGTISSVFFVMNLVLAFSVPIFGLLTLKISPARIMIFGAIMAGIGYIGSALFGYSYPALIIFLGVMIGLGGAALCYSIVYAAAVPVIGIKYSIVFGGILAASPGAISMFSAPIIDIGANTVGIQTCLIGIGAITLLLIPLCFLFIHKKSKKETLTHNSSLVQKPESLRKILKSTVTISFFIMMALGMFTYGICDGGMINHQFEYSQMFHISTYDSALFISIYCCSTMIGAILGGIICSRVKNSKLVLCTIFLIWALIALSSYLLPVGYAIGYAQDIISGLCMGMVIPTLTSIAQKYVSIERFAAIFSMLYIFILLAIAIDSLVGGLLFDIFNNFFIIDMIAVGLSLLTFIIFGISGMKDRKKDKAELIKEGNQ